MQLQKKCYQYKNSQAVKKVFSSKGKKDVKSKVAAKKWLY